MRTLTRGLYTPEEWDLLQSKIANNHFAYLSFDIEMTPEKEQDMSEYLNSVVLKASISKEDYDEFMSWKNGKKEPKEKEEGEEAVGKDKEAVTDDSENPAKRGPGRPKKEIA